MAELTSNKSNKSDNFTIRSFKRDGEHKGYLVGLMNPDGIQESVDWIDVHGKDNSIIMFSKFRDLHTKPIKVLYKDDNDFRFDGLTDIPSIVRKIRNLLFPSPKGGRKSRKSGKSRKSRKSRKSKCRK